MIFEIINIRIKQIFRILLQIGFVRTILLFGMLSVTIFYVFIFLKTIEYRVFVVGVFSLLILVIHFKRKDKIFLSIYSAKPYLIYITEYLLLSILLIIPLVYNKLWIHSLAYILIVILIPFIKINIKKSSINSVFQNKIPYSNFEWKAGIRKNLIVFIVLWFIGFFSSFFVVSVPIVIFILGVIILNFYENAEPLQILIAQELSPKKFLAEKIKSHLKIFTITVAPLILAFIIFNAEYYYVVLVEYIFFLSLIIYTILLKYAFYTPNKKSGAMQIYTTIGIAAIFLPVLSPLIIILSIKFLSQAINNLKFYLNDFN